MEQLVLSVIWFLIELFLQVLTPIPSWPSSGKKKEEGASAVAGSFGWFIGGIFLGFIWAVLFPRFILQTPELRLANLVCGPILSGYVALVVSRRRGNDNSNIRPRNHFWYAYWFTMGLIATRYGVAYREMFGW